MSHLRRAALLAQVTALFACSSAGGISSSGGPDPSTTGADGGASGDSGVNVAPDGGSLDAGAEQKADPARACDVPISRAFTCREGATVSTGANPPPDGVYDRIAIGSSAPPPGTSCESSLQLNRGTYQWVFWDIIEKRGGGTLIRDDAKGTMDFVEVCKNEYGIGNWKYSYQYDAKTERLSIENESRAWVYQRRKP